LVKQGSYREKIDQGFTPGSIGKSQKGIYPFVTGQDFVLDNPASDTTFNFKGGNVTLELRTQDTGELVQTLHFNFPDGEFKTPTIPANSAFTNYNTRLANGGGLQIGSAPILALPQDTIVEVETAGSKGNANDTSPDGTAGDYRMIAAMADVPASKFRPHMDYSKTGTQFAHSLYMAFGAGFSGATLGTLAPVSKYSSDAWHKPHVPSRVGTMVTRMDGLPGDWDTGWGDEPDGAYINKSDDGDLSGQGSNIHLAYTLGYPTQIRPSGDTYFSPNRQVPSPLMFGSIPTGVQRLQPWQTLLFHPRPEDTKHPGKLSPRDHLIADLFWMPVVEPYAISQPFSTAGKINLNYQIVPFAHIKRSTGLNALMKSTRFLALSLADGPGYKLTVGSGGQLNFSLGPRRLPINVPETLKAFDTKFASKDASINSFKSASQICEMNLVPAGTSYTSDDASMATFWNNNKLTGDNVKEKPYVDIYPRLTTKSNTYTVHVWVETVSQGLPKNTSSSDARWAQWDEMKGQVTAQYRGSTLIERYIDPQDPRLTSFDETYDGSTQVDANGNITRAGSLDPFYRFRVLNTRRFDR
jgi:uncharacterized protein (TIGR02600 family)